MKQATTIQCLHPEGKHAPAISAEIFGLFEKAIYHGLKGKKNGITYSELMEEVKKCFTKQKTAFKGSIGWYGVAVKQHMEATGVIKTCMEKGKKLHRLS